VSAELAARRTAAAAVLSDYQRAAAEGADVADRALWAARLADVLGLVLAALGEQRGPAQDATCECGHAAADHHVNQVTGDSTYCNMCAAGACAAFSPASQPAGPAGQLEEIRLVLEAFDWETDDLQYALEQIDGIVNGDGR
jgi:hypothetical protein